MKVIVTGVNGMLGSEIFKYFTSRGHTVYALKRENISWRTHDHNIDQLAGYDCIIHAAANTNVEYCEINPDSCYKDNTLLTERLAYAASRANCKFVYISSTGVYGKNKKNEPYTDYDSVNPCTHHHNSKWLGEIAVNRYGFNPLILRAGWIFGGNPENPKNFISNRIKEAIRSDSNQIQANSQQIGTPTSVNDFTVKMYELLIDGQFGTFNLVNQGRASRYEYVSKILEFAEMDVRVIPAMAAIFNRNAQVSNNETAVNLKLNQLGYQELPFWQDSLCHYINNDIKLWLYETLKNEKN